MRKYDKTDSALEIVLYVVFFDGVLFKKPLIPGLQAYSI